MLVPDVNVFVTARSEDIAGHERCARWLRHALNGIEPVGISELVLSGVVRLLTNHRVLRQPESLERALTFCERILEAPAAVPLRPGTRHWDIFVDLCRAVGARRNVVPDAYHAALAIENGATFVTRDRGFHRFPDLRLVSPLD